MSIQVPFFLLVFLAQGAQSETEPIVQRFLERVAAKENSQGLVTPSESPFNKFTSSSNVVALKVSTAATDAGVSAAIDCTAPEPLSARVDAVSGPLLPDRTITSTPRPSSVQTKDALSTHETCIHVSPANVASETSSNNSSVIEVPPPSTPPRDHSTEVRDSLENTPTGSDIPMDEST